MQIFYLYLILIFILFPGCFMCHFQMIFKKEGLNLTTSCICKRKNILILSFLIIIANNFQIVFIIMCEAKKSYLFT